MLLNSIILNYNFISQCIFEKSTRHKSVWRPIYPPNSTTQGAVPRSSEEPFRLLYSTIYNIPHCENQLPLSYTMVINKTISDHTKYPMIWIWHIYNIATLGHLMGNTIGYSKSMLVKWIKWNIPCHSTML